MINDPSELMLGVQEREEEVEPDPFEEHRRVFHAHIKHRRDDTVPHRNFAVDICRFDSTGKHVQMAKHCPHYDQMDEEGIRINPAWTVQS